MLGFEKMCFVTTHSMDLQVLIFGINGFCDNIIFNLLINNKFIFNVKPNRTFEMESVLLLF